MRIVVCCVGVVCCVVVVCCVGVVFFFLFFFTHGAGRLQGDLGWLASAR